MLSKTRLDDYYNYTELDIITYTGTTTNMRKHTPYFFHLSQQYHRGFTHGCAEGPVVTEVSTLEPASSLSSAREPSSRQLEEDPTISYCHDVIRASLSKRWYAVVAHISCTQPSLYAGCCVSLYLKCCLAYFSVHASYKRSLCSYISELNIQLPLLPVRRQTTVGCQLVLLHSGWLYVHKHRYITFL